MKKLFLVLAAAFAMVACQTDLNEVNVKSGLVDVTFEVGAPAARAYSDGYTATVLQYAVYEGETELDDLTVTNGEIHGSTTVSFKLVTGNTYTVIFWAAAPNAPYTVDFANKTMTVNYTGAVCNAENRDAFYKRHTFTVTGAQTETIELKRPFAQLNIGTNDYDEAKSAGYEPTKSYVKVTQLGNVLNLWNDKVEGTDAVITFDYDAIPTGETFPVAGYDYLAMNYLLVDSEKEVIDIEFGYTETDKNAAKTRIVGSVPVQRNYRTNIYGQLLTSDVDVNVVIVPEYNEPAHEADALFLAAAVGGEVTLTDDVVLSSALNVQSNMTINLDGHNITIDAAYDSVNYEASSAIVNNAVLTLTGNGEISATNNYTVRNNGTMVIDGVTVKNGIMNFGELTVESGNISNSRSGKHTIYGNAAKLTINGGTFHNENAGNAAIFAYGGEVVINGGEFTIADGTATFGWTSCLLDAQGSAKYTINGGVVMGEIRDYNKNTTVYGGAFGHSSVKNFLAAGYKAVLVNGLYYVLPETVADAATTAGVTVVAESTSAVNNALANNGEVVLYTWNGVYYIAKAGEIAAYASEQGSTTVRGIVENSTALTSATVAEGIDVIGNRTFRRCYELESIVLPSTLTEIASGAFQSCKKLTNITIPAGVTTIGDFAFGECSALTSINIPAGVTRIEANTFNASGLNSIVFPESVIYIGAQAFRDCKQLKEVKILAPEFTIEANAFGVMAGTLPGTTIYVANAEMKAYLESTLAYKNQLTIVVPNTVSTSTELQTALNNVSEGEVIVLSDNFTFTEGANGTTNGISVTGAENFVLDLNGNTVTSDLGGNALRFKIGEGNGITNQNVTVTIKNGKVVSGANNWCAISATGANGNKLTLNLEDIEIENNKSGDYAVKAWTGATINAKNVTVTSNAGGSFYAVGGEIVLDGCSAVTTSGSAAYMAAALGISGKGKMTVNSGTYTATPSSANGQWVVYLMSSGGEFVVNGGTFNGTVASGNASYACGLICADTGAKVTLNGGTYNSNGAILDMRNNTGGSPNPTALLAGGDYSNDPRVSGLYASNLITVADGKTVAQGSNSRWTVK